ncbi:MAG: hypothetical protein AAF441_06545 [Pseudomonadota bacterium]
MRANRIYSKHSTLAAAGLLTAAAFLSTAAMAKVPDAGAKATSEAVIKLPASVDAKPEYDIRSLASPMASGVELAAKLSADGNTIVLPVHWIIYGEPADKPGSWQKLHDVRKSAPRFDLKPGRYVVQTNYGKTRTSRRIEVLADQTTAVTVTLNVGALRLFSRLAGPARPGVTAEHTVYKLTGLSGEAQLIGKSTQPGDIMRVSAGSYRVVSRFLPGNSVVRKTMKVKPGLISPVQLDHNAGVARLLAVHADKAEPVKWVITDNDGEIVSISDDRQPSLVLRAGSYTATVTVRGVGKHRKFDVQPGEMVRIEVGG